MFFDTCALYSALGLPYGPSHVPSDVRRGAAACGVAIVNTFLQRLPVERLRRFRFCLARAQRFEIDSHKTSKPLASAASAAIRWITGRAPVLAFRLETQSMRSHARGIQCADALNVPRDWNTRNDFLLRHWTKTCIEKGRDGLIITNDEHLMHECHEEKIPAFSWWYFSHLIIQNLPIVIP